MIGIEYVKRIHVGTKNEFSLKISSDHEHLGLVKEYNILMSFFYKDLRINQEISKWKVNLFNNKQKNIGKREVGKTPNYKYLNPLTNNYVRSRILQ